MKSFGLCLGGGAAKGLAHIGVYKYLLEYNCMPSEIAGTSMGAIIGACIALKMPIERIITFLKDINYLKLIDLNFPNSLVSGDKVYKKLEDLFGTTLIENTSIPLKIIATDANSGEKVVFISGKIIDALRASISLPTIFEVFEHQGISYLDGGLTSNLPMTSLSSTDIVAVSVVKDTNYITSEPKKGGFFKKYFIGNGYEVFNKTLSVIFRNNELLEYTLAQNKKKQITLLSIDTSKFEFYDFKAYKALINTGYEYAKKHLDLTLYLK